MMPPPPSRRFASGHLYAIFAGGLALAAAGVAPRAAGAEPPVRGRDPWAFRLTLENRTRMLVVALRSDLWAAYNPANGTLYKVWNGGLRYRGKVYDFGQRNSETLGTTYHLEAKGVLLSARNPQTIPAGWSATGISVGTSAWTLTGAGSVLASPAVDLRRHERVVLAYQTPGANNRLRVDVSADNGASWNAQQWMSMDSPGDDGHQKLLAVSGEEVRVRFRRNATGSTATLAEVTLFGDYRAWSLEREGVEEFPRVDWRGYRLIGGTEGIALRYDLVLGDGSAIEVEERPEALAGAGLWRRFGIVGLPAGGRLSLELDGSGYRATRQVSGEASLRTRGGETFLDFERDGQSALETTWSP